jgi:hypothetical protein
MVLQGRPWPPIQSDRIDHSATRRQPSATGVEPTELAPNLRTHTLSLLFGHSGEQSYSEMQARFKAYRDGLRRDEKRMPASAFAFANADWHYDHSDPRCPHDAWVESLTVVEPSSGERREVRSLEIRIELLGAYHDGRIRLTYSGVRQYSFFQPRAEERPAPSRGHGDWLLDEVRVSEHSRPQQLLVVHEVLLAAGGTWMIECADILYEWVPEGR